MIRHIHNAVPHSLTARTAARPAATTKAETNPFSSILAATSSAGNTPVSTAVAGKTSHVQISQSDVATITATVTKDAGKPVVTLSPPAFETGATVTNPDGSIGALNWTQFADASTADQLAAKLGGTVTNSTMDGYSATQRSITVPGSPNLVNAGVAAQLFAQYGDKPGSPAWQIINRDLGRDPMST